LSAGYLFYGSLLTGTNPQTQKFNMLRECIRYFFPVHKYFVFDWPTSDEKLLYKLEKVTENQL
jgi:hypothetical protein